MLTLFHGKDSRALRVLWLLQELNLPVRLVNLPFPPRSRAPWYLEENALGTLPLLVDGETRLTESVAICLYINGKYDGSLGVDPASTEYGEWLMWTVFGEATLNYTLSVCLRYGWIERPENRKPDVVEYYKGRFREKIDFLSEAIADKEFLVCSRFTIADISVGYNFVLAEYMGYLDELPQNIKEYWSRLKSRPGYQRCLQLESDTPRSFERPADL